MWFPRESLNAVWRHWAGRPAMIALLALTPLVLALGVRWKLDRYQIRDFAIQTNRERCIEIARTFLAERGVMVAAGDWRLKFEENRNFLEYIHRGLGLGKSLPRIRDFPSAPASVRVQSGGDARADDATEVSISPSGVVTGYRLPSLLNEFGGELGDRQAAVAGARARMIRIVSPSDYEISEERVYEQTDPRGRRFYRVEWTAVHRLQLSFRLLRCGGWNGVFAIGRRGCGGGLRGTRGAGCPAL